jgi:hypothetical protein
MERSAIGDGGKNAVWRNATFSPDFASLHRGYAGYEGFVRNGALNQFI